MMDKILSQFGPSRKELISILHAVQAEYGYVPKEAIARISRFLRVSEGEIFGVLTFYKGFSLDPRGKFFVTVCLGTACHVRGGANIAAELERRLGVKLGGTTPDRLFTLEAVNCLGCCAIGPVVAINGEYYGHATIRNVETILEKYLRPPAAFTQAPGEPGEHGPGKER
jgi:NADH-quinone oxidoreductase subunit E